MMLRVHMWTAAAAGNTLEQPFVGAGGKGGGSGSWAAFHIWEKNLTETESDLTFQ